VFCSFSGPAGARASCTSGSLITYYQQIGRAGRAGDRAHAVLLNGLVSDTWRPEPRPGWVAAVPSERYPELVRDFAERLANALRLPCLPALRKVRDTVPQRTMENSAHRLRNVAGAFNVDGKIPREPVLLVDDTVGSRWTFTEVAYVLRSAGSGYVYPLALAKTADR
jgi:ATP-dependent DNA helicase RecQ